MDSNPIHRPSPAKKMKCSFLDYVQLLMIGWAGQWTRTPSTTPLQLKELNACFWITFNFWWSAWLVDGFKPYPPPLSSQKNQNAHFWIMFNFWWSAGLVVGLETHPPPLSSEKNKMLVFGLHSTSDDQSGSSANPLQPKQYNAHFWIMFNFWWLVGLVDGLKPHPPPLSSQKNEMLIFGLHSTSDDRRGWSMDSNPSPAKNIKCSFLYYVQLLMIGWAGRWTQTPSTTPLQPEK